MTYISRIKPAVSVVIPVYNSSGQIGETVDRTLEFLEGSGWSHELVLVNDGSADGSWAVIEAKARDHPRVIPVNLRTNHGQHAAILCGMRQASGDFVVTMDDDLQNPPGEIARLVERATEGHDVVFGRLRRKRHPLVRRLGSRLIHLLNRVLFRPPSGLALSNFRLLRRDVVDRILASRPRFPYITGLALVHGRRPSDIEVEHRPRALGRSTYSTAKLIRLAAGIAWHYGPFPWNGTNTGRNAVSPGLRPLASHE